MPAATVTLNGVAWASRERFGVKASTRVSIQRQPPATAGSIVIAGFGASTPTSATGTIGSANRTRITASASTSPAGKICGGVTGTTGAVGAGGAVRVGSAPPSATVLPTGTTKAIGCVGPVRGGGNDGARTDGAFAFAPERSGSGSRRAIKAAVLAAERSVIVTSGDPICASGVRDVIAPATSVSSRGTDARAPDVVGAAVVGAVATRGATGRVAGGGGRQPPAAVVAAAHTQIRE